MNEQDVKAIEHAVERAVARAFARAGINISDDWQEVQRDMAFVRELRLGAERTRLAVFTSAVLTVVTGCLYLIWDSIKGGAS